jgi:predicted TIM-barrel fold metal-dependent hydrolase
VRILPCSTSQREAMLGGNAARLFGLNLDGTGQ